MALIFQMDSNVVFFQRFERLNKLSTNKFKIIFHEVENELKHEPILLENIENAWDRVGDLMLLKIQWKSTCVFGYTRF